MKLKSKDGITLIALVITIILLLILAGVTIATLTGENGLLNRAKTAKETSQNATVEENATLDEYSDTVESYVTENRNTNPETNIYSTTEQVVGKWIDGKIFIEQL